MGDAGRSLEVGAYQGKEGQQTHQAAPGVSVRRWVTVERLLTAGTVAAILGVWYLVTELHLVRELFVPRLASVVAAFVDITFESGYRGRMLLEHLSDSLFRVMVAFLLGIVTAVPLGLAIGYSSKIRAIFDPLLEFYRPLPPLAYYTLLVIWLGIENESKISLLYLSVFPALAISAIEGVRGVPIERLNAARSLGAGRWQVFRHVIAPSCLPSIFTGMRVGIGLTYSTLVAAEMVAATSGVGWMVLDASRFLNSHIIFMGIIVMGFTGIALDRCVRYLDRRIVPWRGRG